MRENRYRFFIFKRFLICAYMYVYRVIYVYLYIILFSNSIRNHHNSSHHLKIHSMFKSKQTIAQTMNIKFPI